jgi:hypothetical protein
MQQRYRWFAEMPPAQRSTVGLLVQAGVRAFADWLTDTDDTVRVTAEVFAAAPPEMARAVSLQQTVDLVRTAVHTVEERLGELAVDEDEPALHLLVLQFSREIGFAVASVYARAAEEQGAWHARHEALVIDAVVRDEVDESAASAAASLGWPLTEPVAVLALQTRDDTGENVLAQVRSTARHIGLPALLGLHEDRLLVLVASHDPAKAAQQVCAEQATAGPVVVGDPVPTLAEAGRSAAAALSGLRAVAAWPDAPSPVAAAALLPERALDGDGAAREQLLAEIYRPLCAAGTDLVSTADAYLDRGGSVEATARTLFVHPNTVRYRLRRIADVTGVDPANARGAFALRLALTWGRVL